MGREVTVPYLGALKEKEETKKALGNSARSPIFMLGALQMLFAFIPIGGWLIMPLLITYQIIGFSYALEEARKKA